MEDESPSRSKHNIRQTIGNLLMLLGIGILGFIYYPFLILYLYPQDIQFEIQSQQNYIYIPKIAAFSPIISNVDPWNESDYGPALSKGVALAKGFSSPDQSGTIYMFAHSSNYPWEMTRFNTAFLKLDNLQPGDMIKLKWNGQDHNFKVVSKMEVWPNQVEALNQRVGPNQQLLILQTCTPVPTALKRLLVFATPENQTN